MLECITSGGAIIIHNSINFYFWYEDEISAILVLSNYTITATGQWVAASEGLLSRGT